MKGGSEGVMGRDFERGEAVAEVGELAQLVAKQAELLELLKPTVRARIMQKYDDGSMSEAKLKRMTESDPEYIASLGELIEAKSKAEQLRIRYDSYKNLFEAKRSLLSYQKAEMNLI